MGTDVHNYLLVSKFTQFLENKRRKKADQVAVKSTFSNFVVSKTSIDKKPGQRNTNDIYEFKITLRCPLRSVTVRCGPLR